MTKRPHTTRPTATFAEALSNWKRRPHRRAAVRLDRMLKPSVEDLADIPLDDLVTFTQACLREEARWPISSQREAPLKFIIDYLGEAQLNGTRMREYNVMMHAVTAMLPHLVPPGDTHDNDLLNASDPEGNIP